MLFQESDSVIEIWQMLKHELHRGALDAKHPFHWFNLGTISDDFPSVRTVVLRRLSEELHFLVFTDHRSEKCTELKGNPNASLHFYHPKRQTQVRIKAQSIVHFQDGLTEELFQTIPPHRRAEYKGLRAPGTTIPNPAAGWKLGESSSHFFSVLEFLPLEIEVLQLSREGHLRALFSKSKDWDGIWLMP